MMKRLSSFALAVALVTNLSGFACADESFRCGAQGNKQLVMLGETDQSVREKCGEPQSSYSGRWVYNLGESDFIYSLFFRRGRLVSIDRCERGTGNPNPVYVAPPTQAQTAQPSRKSSSSSTFDIKAYCQKVGQAGGGSYQIEETCRQQEAKARYNIDRMTVSSEIINYCSKVGQAGGGSYSIMETCIKEEAASKNRLRY